MKLQFTHSRTLAWGAMLATAGLFSLCAKADEWNKRTIITIDQPMQISDTLLQPGQYQLRLYDSPAERHVVQIWNNTGQHLINTVMAIPTIQNTYQPSGHTEFTFWETPPGTAKALRDWYYPGSIVGNEFPYPKHPQQIAMAATAPVAPAPPAAASATTEESTTTTTTTEPAGPPEEATPAPEPAAPPAVEPAPAPAPAPEAEAEPNAANRAAAPAELPKTASPYPLFGLCGIVFAGLAAMLRIKQTA